MSGIVGVVCLADEVHEVCTSVYIEFFHDLVLELAGGEGWALDGGSRRRCFGLDTAKRCYGVVGGARPCDGERVGCGDRGQECGQIWVEFRQKEGSMAVAGDCAGVL